MRPRLSHVWNYIQLIEQLVLRSDGRSGVGWRSVASPSQLTSPKQMDVWKILDSQAVSSLPRSQVVAVHSSQLYWRQRAGTRFYRCVCRLRLAFFDVNSIDPSISALLVKGQAIGQHEQSGHRDTNVILCFCEPGAGERRQKQLVSGAVPWGAGLGAPGWSGEKVA